MVVSTVVWGEESTGPVKFASEITRSERNSEPEEMGEERYP